MFIKYLIDQIGNNTLDILDLKFKRLEVLNNYKIIKFIVGNCSKNLQQNFF